MLKLFDKNHNAIGHLIKYKDCKVESDVETGDKSLSFTYLAKHHNLANEMYIRTREDEYVIKEISEGSDGFPQIVAALNLEELEAQAWQTFTVNDVTIDEAAQVVLAGTGWTIGERNVTKRRNAGMVQVNSLEVIQKLCIVFMCDPVFDTINKKVSFYEQRGEDKGVYFLHGLNLKKLQKKSSSYDFYTRIVPIGADELTIESVNDGKNYLENFQYSNKIRTYIWKDESYTDPQALKEDAEKYLNDLSKPETAYSAEVRDLAKQKPGYSILSYGLGDTITLIDPGTGTREKQRIKRMTEYPDNPENNTCEIANTFLTFEELQDKLQAAADIVNYAMTGDGKIYVSDILNFEKGITESVTVSGIQNSVAGVRGDIAATQGAIATMQGDLANVKVTLGDVVANSLTVEEAKLKYATIEQANIIAADVHILQGDYADFKTATAEEFSAQRALIDDLTATQITTDYLNAHYATVNLANVQTGAIKTAMIDTGAIQTAQIADGAITNLKVAGDLDAAKITAGTLSVDRLEIRGSTNSIVYQLNNITGALQAQNVDTLNGEILTPRTITADKIVANSITGNEIAAKTITANNIVANSITGDQIQASTIDTIHLKANSITGNLIEANTIETKHLKASSITAEKINVTDLFAQDITATGTIRGVTLEGATGSFTGSVVASSLNATASGKISIFSFDQNGFYADFGGDKTNEYLFSERSFIVSARANGTIGAFVLGEMANAKGNVRICAKDKISLETELLQIHGTSGESDETSVGIIGDLYVSKGIYEDDVLLSNKYAAKFHAHNTIGSGNNMVNTATGNDCAGLSKKNNVNIDTWYGFSVSNKCAAAGQGVAGDGVAFSVNARNGDVYSAGKMNPYGGIQLPDTATSWIGGMTSTKCLVGTAYTSATGGSYHPILRQNTALGNVFNLGGITASSSDDQFGIYIYKSGRTTNACDYRTYWNATNGNLTHAGGLLIVNNMIKSYRSGSNEAQVHVQNSLRDGYLCASGTGRLGIYDGTTGHWMIMSETNGLINIRDRSVVPPEGTAAIRPYSDNAYTCGHASYRYTYVYAKNATIQTSDEREKEILSLAPEEMSAYYMSLEPIAYRWRYDDDRRIRFGLGAQTTERKLRAAGYNPADYSMIQHDYLDEPSGGMTDRYGMDYQSINILTMMQAQKNTRELTVLQERQKTTDIDIAVINTKQETLETQVSSLREQLQEARRQIARQDAEIAQLKAMYAA